MTTRGLKKPDSNGTFRQQVLQPWDGVYLISLSRLDSVIPIAKFVSGTGIPNVLNVPGSSNRLNSASKPVKNSVL